MTTRSEDTFIQALTTALKPSRQIKESTLWQALRDAASISQRGAWSNNKEMSFHFDTLGIERFQHGTLQCYVKTYQVYFSNPMLNEFAPSMNLSVPQQQQYTGGIVGINYIDSAAINEDDSEQHSLSWDELKVHVMYAIKHELLLRIANIYVTDHHTNDKHTILKRPVHVHNMYPYTTLAYVNHVAEGSFPLRLCSRIMKLIEHLLKDIAYGQAYAKYFACRKRPCDVKKISLGSYNVNDNIQMLIDMYTHGFMALRKAHKQIADKCLHPYAMIVRGKERGPRGETLSRQDMLRLKRLYR